MKRLKILSEVGYVLLRYVISLGTAMVIYYIGLSHISGVVDYRDARLESFQPQTGFMAPVMNFITVNGNEFTPLGYLLIVLFWVFYSIYRGFWPSLKEVFTESQNKADKQ